MPPLLMDLLYLPAAALYLPFLLYQMIVLGKNRRGWGQRLGGVPLRSGDKPCVWIHAVSLGEVNATRTLVDEITRRLPDHDVVVSATTDTGYAAALKLYPGRIVFRYPLDLSPVVRRVFRRIRPGAIILMELEVWPNFITLAHRAGVPICIANGRVTEEKSMRRFRKPVIRTIARGMFSRITWTAAQDETYARRFVELGVDPDRVHVVGNLKYDTAEISDKIAGADELAAAMGIDRTRPLVVAGSTGPGEEEMLLEAFETLRPGIAGLQLAIIPRKPERFDEVARLIESRGYECRRRSRMPDGARQDPPADRPVVFLGDTMGELRKFYSLATVVFVGRSLVPLGGSDVMEVAGLGKPMCFGPYMENFAEAVHGLLSGQGAIQVRDAANMAPALDRLLSDPAASTAFGANARAFVARNTGTTKKTIDLLIAAIQ
ncbi:MAG: hypothetical protein DCC65_16835 [Planctomycetota bacterium]|nr:MAG: hypothetical protein DCC65_16835 [Planctomycetota bacterium]